MNPFADVIERKQMNADSSKAKLDFENEVKNFIRETCRTYEDSLLEIFDERVVKFPDWSYVRIKDYRLDVVRDYGKQAGDYIEVGHYNVQYGQTRIPFRYDMNKSQLTGIIKEAMRALVMKVYQTK